MDEPIGCAINDKQPKQPKRPKRSPISLNPRQDNTTRRQQRRKLALDFSIINLRFFQPSVQYPVLQKEGECISVALVDLTHLL